MADKQPPPYQQFQEQQSQQPYPQQNPPQYQPQQYQPQQYQPQQYQPQQYQPQQYQPQQYQPQPYQQHPQQHATYAPLPQYGVPIGHVQGLIMKAHYSMGFLVLMIFCYILVTTAFLTNVMFAYDSSLRVFWIMYFLLLFIVLTFSIIFRLPKRIELQSSCIVLYSMLSSWSIAYERIQSVEIVPTICCWFGHACTMPKGGFTSFENGVFFRSPDCGQSICFSPEDAQAFMNMVRQTPLGQRIIQTRI